MKKLNVLGIAMAVSLGSAAASAGEFPALGQMTDAAKMSDTQLRSVEGQYHFYFSSSVCTACLNLSSVTQVNASSLFGFGLNGQSNSASVKQSIN